MTRPARPSRKAAFSSDEEKIQHERDKLDDVLETLPSRNGEPPRLQSVPALPATAPADSSAGGQRVAAEVGQVLVTEVGERISGDVPGTAGPVSVAPAQSAPANPSATADEVSATSAADRPDRKSAKAAGPVKQAEESPKKPPAAWISSDVYLRLVEYSDTEKRMKRTAARPFGVIAMDAIENHAEALASAWKGSGSGSPPPGRLFVRELNSRYRRHDLPPRSITLQGVGPENAKLLKRLKRQWGAGSVSDLVEKALRFEFGMGGDRG